MEKKHHHGGHRARLRQRYLSSPESVNDHELLELLLFYAIPQKDTNELAHRLLARFGSFSELLFASRSQIAAVEGMGETSALLFPLIQDLFRRHLKEVIDQSPQKTLQRYHVPVVANRYLPLFDGLRVEKLLVVGLDVNHRVIGDVLVASGDQDSARLNIPNLSKFLLQHDPKYVVVAHNHPSGVGLPSESDYAATDSLRGYLDYWGIPLLDHLIFDGQGDYVSFLESGNLQVSRPSYGVWLHDPLPVIETPSAKDAKGPAPAMEIADLEIVNNLQKDGEDA
ncbi:MAG: hypothetical protein J6C26_07935 [Clostridia bacterium]|nr:hypothetical protein [Clostridia bacterium]